LINHVIGKFIVVGLEIVISYDFVTIYFIILYFLLFFFLDFITVLLLSNF